ncbi:MAG: hypothetical protein FJ395_15040 [Verrucomicrobia bacterium]|nr:hypothetical protein [Verrucomicrobiota bacterium]
MRVWMLVLCCGAIALAEAAPVKNTAATPQPKKETLEAMELFKKTDPKMDGLFTSAFGCAVFPSVAKGAFGIGAARGSGEVFQQGRLIGSATLTQVTIGFQLGGQEYAELIFFENEAALTKFTSNQFAMSAQASAVAAAEGASTNAKYQQGVLVFTIAKGGLMFEASVGGQKFKFTPLSKPPGK